MLKILGISCFGTAFLPFNNYRSYAFKTVDTSTKLQKLGSKYAFSKEINFPVYLLMKYSNNKESLVFKFPQKEKNIYTTKKCYCFINNNWVRIENFKEIFLPMKEKLPIKIEFEL